MTCSICIEDIYKDSKIIKLDNCNHIYHELCLYKWIYKNNTCPLCRKEIYSIPKLEDYLEDTIEDDNRSTFIEIPYNLYNKISLEASYSFMHYKYNLDTIENSEDSESEDLNHIEIDYV